MTVSPVVCDSFQDLDYRLARKVKSESVWYTQELIVSSPSEQRQCYSYKE